MAASSRSEPRSRRVHISSTRRAAAPSHERVAVEGEFHVMSRRFEIGGMAFDQWELEELEDV